MYLFVCTSLNSISVKYVSCCMQLTIRISEQCERVYKLDGMLSRSEGCLLRESVDLSSLSVRVHLL
jgi:hypothetical protein